eukprot:9943999-Lingulodinium_polyedra.AAC.1
MGLPAVGPRAPRAGLGRCGGGLWPYEVLPSVLRPIGGRWPAEPWSPVARRRGGSKHVAGPRR